MSSNVLLMKTLMVSHEMDMDKRKFWVVSKKRDRILFLSFMGRINPKRAI
jgi:hypothetical protein